MSENTTPSQEESINSPGEQAPTPEEKQMAMFCHLSAFVGLIIPFGSVIAPLVIWLMKKDQSEYIDYHGKEAINFQITMAIAFAISFILMFVLIGFFLLIGLGVFWLIVIIIGGIKANDGLRYQYPFSIRFIK